MAVVGGAAGLVPAPEGPHVLLVLPVDVAPDLEPPGLCRLAGKAQLAERNAQLGGPAGRVHLRGPLPDRVPRAIAVELVALHTRRIDLEPGVIQVIVVGVQPDDQLVRGERIEGAVVAVRVQQLIPPREGGHHPAGLAQAGADVERLVVVQDAYLHGQRCGRSLIGLGLPELSARPGVLPRGLVQLHRSRPRPHAGPRSPPARRGHAPSWQGTGQPGQRAGQRAGRGRERQPRVAGDSSCQAIRRSRSKPHTHLDRCVA
jgi:hypothetical protein